MCFIFFCAIIPYSIGPLYSSSGRIKEIYMRSKEPLSSLNLNALKQVYDAMFSLLFLRYEHTNYSSGRTLSLNVYVFLLHLKQRYPLTVEDEGVYYAFEK